jgi:hypothetical protein
MWSEVIEGAEDAGLFWFMYFTVPVTLVNLTPISDLCSVQSMVNEKPELLHP